MGKFKGARLGCRHSDYVTDSKHCLKSLSFHGTHDLSAAVHAHILLCLENKQQKAVSCRWNTMHASVSLIHGILIFNRSSWLRIAFKLKHIFSQSFETWSVLLGIFGLWYPRAGRQGIKVVVCTTTTATYTSVLPSSHPTPMVDCCR